MYDVQTSLDYYQGVELQPSFTDYVDIIKDDRKIQSVHVQDVIAVKDTSGVEQELTGLWEMLGVKVSVT